MKELIRVLIVGAGPRGLSMLERIAAQVAAAGHAAPRVEVSWVDPFEHGPGKVWRTDQSPRYLMNTPSLFPTVVPDTIELAPSLVPVSFDQWRELATKAGNAVVLPADVGAELAALARTDYPSRRLYGHYLRWVWEQLRARLPERMRVDAVRGEVTALAYDGEWLATVVRPGGAEVLVRADAAGLALGHVPARLSPVHAELLALSSQGAGAYVPPQVPSDIEWDAIPAGEIALVRGLGLNFFDIMIQLTEGRGGRFEVAESSASGSAAGSLVYRASGREPRLVVGSRRGTPYRAKAELDAYVPRASVLRSLTVEAVRRLAVDGVQLSFDHDVWPLLNEDVQRNFRAAGGEGEFSIEAMAMPLVGISPLGRDEYQELLREYLAADVQRAHRGEEDPVNIAIGTLNAGRSVIKAIASDGLLTDESWQLELRDWFEPLVEGLASGPPALRIAQLLALSEAGLVEFLGPYPEFVGSGSGFAAQSAMVPDVVYSAPTLIEAMMPTNRIVATVSPLLRSLLDTGVVRARAVILGENEVHFGTGLDVSRMELSALNAAGEAQAGLFVLGLQLSSIKWGTAIAAEAGASIDTGAMTLRDADVIARAILALAG